LRRGEPARAAVRLFSVGVLVAALALSACASRRPAEPVVPEPEPAPEEAPPQEAPPPQVDAEELERLYGRLEENKRQYREGLELIGAGIEDLGEELLAVAAQGLDSGMGECSRMAGCEVERFLETFDRLMAEQNLALKRQASRIEELEANIDEDVEREPGTTPFMADMPEIGQAASLLRGTDLRDIITLNGPVNAALDDWLTWMRPILMEAYLNYQFLRDDITPIYEEAGLPEALLFAIMATETGGKVHAYSKAGAAGPLQFMRHTGRRYGLKEVDGFDMRLDPVAATKANVAYLSDQLEEFDNSLEKALAAYNGGETRIRNLHRRLHGISLWDSRMYYSLPRETREYVPRILAAAWLYLHPQEYNLEWPVPDTEKTRLVLEEDAALGELTICLGQEQSVNGWFRTLRNLNPRLTPGERIKAGEEIVFPAILVPVYEERCLGRELLERARELHEANYPHGSEMILYVVQRGDTLGKIAARHRCVSFRELAVLNNVRAPKYVIHVGQQLKVPQCG